MVAQTKKEKAPQLSLLFASPDLRQDADNSKYQSLGDSPGVGLSISVPTPVPTRQTFVLSPRGDRLAVLTGEQILAYLLPSTPAKTDTPQN